MKGEMANSKPGAGTIQDEPGASGSARKYGRTPKQTNQRTYSDVEVYRREGGAN